jgi:hypothetical protein
LKFSSFMQEWINNGEHWLNLYFALSFLIYSAYTFWQLNNGEQNMSHSAAVSCGLKLVSKLAHCTSKTHIFSCFSIRMEHYWNSDLYSGLSHCSPSPRSQVILSHVEIILPNEASTIVFPASWDDTQNCAQVFQQGEPCLQVK